MILRLFICACIMISFISMSHIGMKNEMINRKKNLFFDVIIGLVSASLAIILIKQPIVLNPDVIFDFRYLPILLTVMYTGTLPAVVSVCLVGLFQIVDGGFVFSDVSSVTMSIVVLISFILLCKFVQGIKKWIFSLLALYLIMGITKVITAGLYLFSLKNIVIYILSYSLLTLIIYKYSEHLCLLIETQKKLENEATVDYLTGVNNVRQFERSLHEVSQLAIRKEENLSILFMDIDFFKKVNDTYGHPVGDTILKKTADLLVETVRVFDVVSRNGGEEFSVLLLDCSQEHAVKIAERIRKKIESYEFEVDETTKIHITISIGVASYPTTSQNIEGVLDDSDKALYEAKRSGRNKVAVFENQEMKNKWNEG